VVHVPFLAAFLNCGESLIEIGNDVVDILDADR
jgi:hypothetical protein